MRKILLFIFTALMTSFYGHTREITTFNQNNQPIGEIWVDQENEVAFSSTSFNVSEEESISLNSGSEGCLTSEYGQYPEETFMPSCVGIVERITEIGWAGEFSKVQVSADTEYVFSSSVVTDFITIANEEGEIVFATGTGLVTWTSPVDQTIRFYDHADEDCSSDEASRTRGVQCGDVPVYDPCAPVFIGGADRGIGFSNDFVAANDINVLAGTQFSVEKIIIDLATFEGEPTTFTVTFHEGETGVETQYGETFENLIPSSIVGTGLFGLIPKYKVELTLPTPQTLPATADADKKYWVSIASAFDSTGGFTYWLGSAYTNTDTLPMWQLLLPNEDDERIWVECMDEFGGTFEGIMSVEGECEELLGINDLKKIDLTLYPNPVKEILNISTTGSIENVNVFNSGGQQVLKDAKVLNGQINVNSLTPGTYVFKVTLENGQVESFKVLKK